MITPILVEEVTRQDAALTLEAFGGGGSRRRDIMWTELAAAPVSHSWDVRQDGHLCGEAHSATVVWRNEYTVVLLVELHWWDSDQRDGYSGRLRAYRLA